MYNCALYLGAGGGTSCFSAMRSRSWAPRTWHAKPRIDCLRSNWSKATYGPTVSYSFRAWYLSMPYICPWRCALIFLHDCIEFPNADVHHATLTVCGKSFSISWPCWQNVWRWRDILICTYLDLLIWHHINLFDEHGNWKQLGTWLTIKVNELTSSFQNLRYFFETNHWQQGDSQPTVADN